MTIETGEYEVRELRKALMQETSAEARAILLAMEGLPGHFVIRYQNPNDGDPETNAAVQIDWPSDYYDGWGQPYPDGSEDGADG